ncbi:MAG: dienelactone hydrolase [Caulobacteraceae bacterium]|nr:dienelactone hydrolase [Caulobacteraceae bacterium]
MNRRLALLALIAACAGPAWAQGPAAAPPTAAPEPTVVEVREPGLYARMFAPAGLQGRAPAILVLGGSEGGVEASGRMARRLAQAGYVTLAVAYFAADGLPPALVEIPIETFDRALAWLERRPEADMGRLGLIGVSKGAEAALIEASRRREFHAVVAGVPSNVVWQGIDLSNWTQAKSSWSIGGRPMDFVPYDASQPFTGIRDLYDRSMRSEGQEGAAAIPVERINADLLLISGGQDGLWNSTEMAARIKRRLEARRWAHRVEHIDYPAAGHGVVGGPVTLEQAQQLTQVGGTAEGNYAARQEVWGRILAFFDRALKP